MTKDNEQFSHRLEVYDEDTSGSDTFGASFDPSSYVVVRSDSRRRHSRCANDPKMSMLKAKSTTDLMDGSEFLLCDNLF